MCSEDVKSFFQRLRTYLKHNDGFIHPHGINLITLFKLGIFLYKLIKLSIALSLDLIYDRVDCLAFSLGVIKELFVLLCKLITFLELCTVISCPYILLIHIVYLLNKSFSYERSSMPRSCKPLSIFFIAELISSSSIVFSLSLNKRE